LLGVGAVHVAVGHAGPQPGRDEQLLSRFQQCTVPNTLGALEPTKFDIVAGDDNVRIAWQIFHGKDFRRWNFELLLELIGHVYVIAYPLNPPADPSRPQPRTPEEARRANPSHARILYGAWNEFKMTYYMDPISADTAWSTDNYLNFKFMVGVADERADAMWSDGWIRPVQRNKVPR
jgi:hypothetical protein